MTVYKRVFDVSLAVALLILIAPVIASVAIAVFIALGPPILFHQLRPGLNDKPFWLVKFRTMHELRDSSGAPLPNDQRLTKFGRFMRSTSLDELPELWNVLRGDMSLVGPRPLLMEYLPLYTPEQRRRHAVRPGITGWAQINGRNELAWEERFRMDVWYVDNHSLWLDIRIVIRTIGRICTRRGISTPGRATIERYRAHKS